MQTSTITYPAILVLTRADRQARVVRGFVDNRQGDLAVLHDDQELARRTELYFRMDMLSGIHYDVRPVPLSQAEQALAEERAARAFELGLEVQS